MPFFYLNKKFQQTKRYYYHFGFKKTFVKVIKSISLKIYTRDVSMITVKDLTEEMKFSFNYKLKVQRIEKSHLDILKEFSERYNASAGSTSITKINDFFENNYDGFIAFYKGDVIGYSWRVNNATKIRKKHPDLILYKIKLRDDDIYGFDLFIAPEYRGNHNAIEFLYKVFSELNKLGYKRVFGYVNPSETSARWIYKLFGFKDIKRIVRHRCFYFILLVNKTIFLKTSRRYLYYPFDYRAVYPFRNIMFLNR